MPTPESRYFTPPPRSDIVDRVGSALAFTLFLSAWVVAYVGVMPADPAPARHVAALIVR